MLYNQPGVALVCGECLGCILGQERGGTAGESSVSLQSCLCQLSLASIHTETSAREMCEPSAGLTEGGDEEDSEYSYVYETDSEYEYESEYEEEKENPDTVQQNDTHPASENVASKDEEDDNENEALLRHKQQLERFKPKVPAYVTSPEPCAFSDDPSVWIAWMEEEVNKEKARRMEIIMKEEDNDQEEETEEKEVEANVSNDDREVADGINPEPVEEPLPAPDIPSVEDCDAPTCDRVETADSEEADEESEWDWEYEDEEGEEAEVQFSLSVGAPMAVVPEESGGNEEKDEENVTECSETGEEAQDGDDRVAECPQVNPAEEENAEKKQIAGVTRDDQMSLPAENRRRELVPREMQDKLDFIRRKKAEASGQGQACSGQLVAGENPAENVITTTSNLSVLDDETRRKLAFIKQRKAEAAKACTTNEEPPPCNESTQNDPNDPLDPETRRKLEFVRKNKKTSAPSTKETTENPSGGRYLRQQSAPAAPAGPKSGGRPNSFAEQYGDDSNLNDMLARIKTLREERKQILQDMNAIKTAFSEPPGKTSANARTAESADTDKCDITDDGIETGESTPCHEINPPFKDDNVHGKNSPVTCPSSLLTRQARRSFDSGIESKSLSSVPGGSPTDELEAGTPNRKKISKEEKENSDGTFHCFICGEHLGKMSAGTVMHMGLEDGEPVCPDALYLTDESKEKIMTIASTRMFTYEAKYELLDTMELETWDLEYDIPAGDVMDKVDAFLHDVEQQKQKDAEKFEAMRNGAIDEIFMEEFKEILSHKNSHNEEFKSSDLARKNVAPDDVSDNAADCQKRTLEAPPAPAPAPAPAPPPPPPPSADIPTTPTAFKDVLQSIKGGALPQLKPTETVDSSEIKVGQVIHKHIAPRVFTRDIRSLVKDISKDDHKQRLRKVKTNDKSAPYIPEDVEIYFYGGQNANKAAPPPPLSTKIKEEYNSSKRR